MGSLGGHNSRLGLVLTAVGYQCSGGCEAREWHYVIYMHNKTCLDAVWGHHKGLKKEAELCSGSCCSSPRELMVVAMEMEGHWRILNTLFFFFKRTHNSCWWWGENRTSEFWPGQLEDGGAIYWCREDSGRIRRSGAGELREAVGWRKEDAKKEETWHSHSYSGS